MKNPLLEVTCLFAVWDGTNGIMTLSGESTEVIYTHWSHWRYKDMFDQNPNSMLSVFFSFHALVTWIIFVNAFCPEILQTTQAKS